MRAIYNYSLIFLSILMQQYYNIRKSTIDDIDVMMSLFESGKLIMRSDGNMEQWTGGYPQRELVAAEIERGNSYMVLTNDGVAVATFALILTDDPTYKVIYNGEWKDDVLPYGTIHRISSRPDYKDVARQVFDFAAAVRPNLRVDTHRDNKIMQHVLLKNGFEYCGIIHLLNGDERLAYQRVAADKCVDKDLQAYVEKHIIPQYAHFDEAHQVAHARSVIRESLNLALHYPVDANMAYAIAAYHDLGLCAGRDVHHVKSAEMVRSDERLLQWFTKEQVETIADAAEDHRASSKKEPRTIYGRIVAEADRFIDADDIMRRTVLFGFEHYPELDAEAQLQRAKDHLAEKYAEGGYLKLWIPDSDNAVRLQNFQQKLKDAVWVDAALHKLLAELR